MKNTLTRWLSVLALIPALAFALGSGVTPPNPNILRGDLASTANGKGAALIGYMPSGASAVAATVANKLLEHASVFDFMTSAQIADVRANTGSIDVTAAFIAAQNAAKEIFVPAGTYLVDNLRFVGPMRRIVCEGIKSTIFKQANVARPAINVLSDVTTGQLQGVAFLNCGVIGAGAGTVATVQVSATSPYVVNFSEFVFDANNTNTALEIIDTANEIYNNRFKVSSYNSLHTAFKTKGVYNEYDLFAVFTQDGTALNDASINSTFVRVVSDGQQLYGGQNDTIFNPTVETIYGTAVYAALMFTGYDHTVLNPTLTNVSNAKCTNQTGFTIYNKHIIINPRVWGTSYPVYFADFGTTGKASMIVGGDVLVTNKLETYMSASDLSDLTLVGNVSSYSLHNAKYQTANVVVNAATYTVDANKGASGLDYSLQNNYVTGTLTITLPSGSAFVGRELKIQNRTTNTVVSASSNVVPMTGSAGTAILSGTIGKWCVLQYDGTNWLITENN